MCVGGGVRWGGGGGGGWGVRWGGGGGWGGGGVQGRTFRTCDRMKCSRFLVMFVETMVSLCCIAGDSGSLKGRVGEINA